MLEIKVAMLTKFFTLITLYCLWLSLTGLPISNSSVLFAVIIPGIAYLLSVKLIDRTKEVFVKRTLRLKNAGRFILYFLWLIKEILKSSFEVIKIIWCRKLNIDPIFEWIDSQTTEFGIILHANSITLTPGTVTLDIKNDMILVHALNKASIDELRKVILPSFL